MIDDKLQQELRERFNPEKSTLRQAQLRMLDMLGFIDKICRENNICYWLDSGTLIGAARHGGFIPWDDDVDICMPRKDLLKFKKLMLSKELSDEFVLQCHETDKYYLSPSWYVLRDLHSEYIQDSSLHNVRKYRGLQVDIFGVENKVIDLFHGICSLYQSLIINKLLMKGHKRIAYLSFLPFNYLVIPIFRLLSCFSKKQYYKMGYGIPIKSKRFIETVFPITRIRFENHMFNAPNCYEKYLENLYSNWELVPQLSEIKTHNVKIVFR